MGHPTDSRLTGDVAAPGAPTLVIRFPLEGRPAVANAHEFDDVTLRRLCDWIAAKGWLRKDFREDDKLELYLADRRCHAVSEQLRRGA